MKKKLLAQAIVLMLLCFMDARGQNFLDFGKFTHQVVGIKPLSGFTSETGEKIAPSRRNVSLFEIKLEIIANDGGEFALNPKLFAAMFMYRGSIHLTPAAALGTKVRDKMTAVEKEYWYTAPDISVNIGVSKNEKFIKYVIVEIPKEVKSFHLLGPAQLAMVKI
ncbi:MAG: hypothetical protein JXI33_04735 [Candidatus Aminicenantes bacterium]|nr:hypothetical protein [Candidatus Aminicenantes bacterium]